MTTHDTTTGGQTLDITALILRAEFLSNKEKIMWIRICEKLTLPQIRKLADILLDEENKRRILLSQMEQVGAINQQYLQELEVLEQKYGISTVRNNANVHSPEVTRKMFQDLSEVH